MTSRDVCYRKCGDPVNTGRQYFECNDGNTRDGDGCSSKCKVELGFTCSETNLTNGLQICKEVCGDGIVRTSECDDGNLENGDGCSDTCEIEQGWVCSNKGGGGGPLNLESEGKKCWQSPKAKLKSGWVTSDNQHLTLEFTD